MKHPEFNGRPLLIGDDVILSDNGTERDLATIVAVDHELAQPILTVRFPDGDKLWVAANPEDGERLKMRHVTVHYG
jgi:hypothetical protein